MVARNGSPPTTVLLPMNRPDKSGTNEPNLAQAATGSSLALVAKFASGLAVAIGFYGLDRRCAFANHAYLAMYATDEVADTLVGRHVSDVIGAESWASVGHHIDAAFLGEHVSYERGLNVGAVDERWLEVHLVPSRDAQRQLSGLLVFVNDISKRTVSDRLLEAAWSRLEQFSQASREGIAFYKDGVLVDCNEAMSTMLGRGRDDLIGRRVMEFFPKSDHEVAQRHIHLGRVAPYPAKLLRPDGSTLDVEINGRVVNWQSDTLHVASVQDMSQLNRVSESLLRSQARYRALVENATEAIVLSQGRRVTYANPAAAALFGRPVDELLGTRTVGLAHPLDREFVRESQRALPSPDHRYEVRVVCPPLADGHLGEIPAESTIKHVQISQALVDWDGSAAALIFLKDITVQRESEAALRKALAQEKELGELKTRFVSMASHEFRTPLATIQTASELLQHYSDRLTGDERDEAVGDIQQAVQRMQAMIDNFLTLGRMSVDEMRFSPSDVVIARALGQITSECAGADGQQHLVMLDVSPQVSMTQILRIDEVLLRLIVGNLLGNACKYSEVGSPVWLKVGRRETANADKGAAWLDLTVSDAGIGIPAQDMPRLFDAFHRASNIGQIRGTGLGLAIVKRAVDAHGGTIEVKSEVGRGSSFSVSLPWLSSI